MCSSDLRMFPDHVNNQSSRFATVVQVRHQGLNLTQSATTVQSGQWRQSGRQINRVFFGMRSLSDSRMPQRIHQVRQIVQISSRLLAGHRPTAGRERQDVQGRVSQSDKDGQCITDARISVYQQLLSHGRESTGSGNGRMARKSASRLAILQGNSTILPGKKPLCTVCCLQC